MCKFNAILIKILKTFLTEIEKNPKIHTEAWKTTNSQSNAEKKKKTTTNADKDAGGGGEKTLVYTVGGI
jgi:hypothetical protein